MTRDDAVLKAKEIWIRKLGKSEPIYHSKLSYDFFLQGFMEAYNLMWQEVNPPPKNGITVHTLGVGEEVFINET